MRGQYRYSAGVEIWLAAFLGAAFLVALALVASRLVARGSRWAADRRAGRDISREASPSAPRNAPREIKPRSCPLCSTPLLKGERVNSQLFPGKEDRIMHIFGCVYCWPATASTPRYCPVCGGALSAEGWVTARYFERAGMPGRGAGSPARGHVHVLGCEACRGK